MNCWYHHCFVRIGDHNSAVIRIKICQIPKDACIDGVQLDRFVPGQQYEVGNLLGAYLLAEGWAEPATQDGRSFVASISEFGAETDEPLPPNLRREAYPPYYVGPELALDRRRTRRRGR